MSMLRRALSVSLLAGAATGALAESPGLGRIVTPEEAAHYDISIAPDGGGLPAGGGTATLGRDVYEAKCLACHGEKGAGKPNDQLVGGFGTLKGDQPAVKTIGSYWPYATTLFDYLRRAMPFNAPKSLTDEEAYAVTAYLLHLNSVIDESFVIDARSLPKIEMPNRNGFVRFAPGQ